MSYRFAAISPGLDLASFDCGEPHYNDWLTRSAERADQAGAARVYVLLAGHARVVGYFAICPTAVVRDTLPGSVRRNAPDPVPGYLIAKLALDRSLRGDAVAMWGTQLLVEALSRIVRAAEVSGGRVIVVDADNEGLVHWYTDHSFHQVRPGGLRLYMKVATARRQLIDSAAPDPPRSS